MNQENDSPPRRGGEIERRILYRLAAERHESSGPCPSPETLAAFQEGRLTGESRRRVIDHLETCSVCYDAWLTAASAGSPAAIPLPIVDRRLEPSAGWRAGWREGLRAPPARYGLSWAAAIALAVALGWWIMVPPSLESQLRLAYSEAIAQGWPPPPPETLGGPVELPSFAPVVPADSIRQDFRAGLAAGSQALGASQLPAVEAPSRAYWLGRWILLVLAACQNPAQPSTAFWQEQQRLIGAFSAEISVERLRNPIATLSAGEKRERACYELSHELRRIVKEGVGAMIESQTPDTNATGQPVAPGK